MGFIRYALPLCLTALVRAIPQAASTDDIPTCAYPPLLSTLQGTGCSLSDINCVCGKQDLIPTITTAVVEACAADPTPVSSAEVMDFIREFCGDAAPAETSSTAAATTKTASSSSAIGAATTTTDLALTSTTEAAVSTPTGYWLWVGNGTCSCAAGNGTSNATVPSLSSPTPTASPVPTNDGEKHSMSVLAFVLAVGGMTWAFAEL